MKPNQSHPPFVLIGLVGSGWSHKTFPSLFAQYPRVDAVCGKCEFLYLTLSSIHVDKKLSCRRDRATLLVIEYFAKSLKVIRNDIVE